MPNPYTPLLPVATSDYFDAARGGRGAHAKAILDHILQFAPRPAPISVIGERRFGKTSLLNYLYRETAAAPNTLRASIDLLSLSPQTTEGFYARLTRSLIWAGAMPRNTLPLTYEDFEDFLFDLDENGRRLILFIDEFDLVTRDLRFEWAFFDNLRSLVINFPLTLVVASVAPLSQMAHQDVFSSPFWNIFEKERLGPLSQQEAEALVSRPDGLGEAIDELVELAGLHPLFLQLACSIAWKLRAEAGGQLDMDVLRNAFEVKIRDHYQYIWDHSSSREQAVLCALAMGSAADGVGLQDLAERGYANAKDSTLTCGTGFAAFVQTQCEAIKAEHLLAPRGENAPPSLDPIQVDPGAQEQRLALIVGVNNYLHQQTGSYFLAPLEYAERDAEEMVALLKQLDFEVTPLLGEEATHDAVQATFAELSQKTVNAPHPESCFVFHFSGHGMIDPGHDETAHLLLHDTNPSNPAAAGLEMNHLAYDLLPKVQVPNALVLLDACHAGFAAGVKHARPEEPERLPNVSTQVFGRVEGRMILAACPGAAQAREIDDLRHGVFTNYLLKHWRDLEGIHPPECIDVSSLHGYVFRIMPQNHPALPPPVWGGAGSGHPLILRHIPHIPLAGGG